MIKAIDMTAVLVKQKDKEGLLAETLFILEIGVCRLANEEVEQAHTFLIGEKTARQFAEYILKNLEEVQP